MSSGICKCKKCGKGFPCSEVHEVIEEYPKLQVITYLCEECYGKET